jgi:hypothetical protein
VRLLWKCSPVANMVATTERRRKAAKTQAVVKSKRNLLK